MKVIKITKQKFKNYKFYKILSYLKHTVILEAIENDKK